MSAPRRLAGGVALGAALAALCSTALAAPAGAATPALTLSTSREPVETMPFDLQVDSTGMPAGQRLFLYLTGASDCAATAAAQAAVAGTDEISTPGGDELAAGDDGWAYGLQLDFPVEALACAYAASAADAAPSAADSGVIGVRAAQASLSIATDDPVAGGTRPIRFSVDSEIDRTLYVFAGSDDRPCAATAAAEAASGRGRLDLGGKEALDVAAGKSVLSVPGSWPGWPVRICGYVAGARDAEPNATADLVAQARAPRATIALAVERHDGYWRGVATGSAEIRGSLGWGYLPYDGTCPADPRASGGLGVYDGGVYEGAFTAARNVPSGTRTICVGILGATASLRVGEAERFAYSAALSPASTGGYDLRPVFTWRAGPADRAFELYRGDPDAGGTLVTSRELRRGAREGEVRTVRLPPLAPGRYGWRIVGIFNGTARPTKTAFLDVTAPPLRRVSVRTGIGHSYLGLVMTTAPLARLGVRLYPPRSRRAISRSVAADLEGKADVELRVTCRRPGRWRWTVSGHDRYGHRAGAKGSVGVRRCARGSKRRR